MMSFSQAGTGYSPHTAKIFLGHAFCGTRLLPRSKNFDRLCPDWSIAQRAHTGREKRKDADSASYPTRPNWHKHCASNLQRLWPYPDCINCTSFVGHTGKMSPASVVVMASTNVLAIFLCAICRIVLLPKIGLTHLRVVEQARGVAR